MKKRMLSLLLALCMALTLLPAAVFAEDGDTPVETLAINGTEFTAERTSIACGEGTAVYDAASKTLTLTNATITNLAESKCGIRSSVDGLTILLVGTNVIELTGSEESMMGIALSADTTVKKTGADAASLTIKAKQAADNIGIYFDAECALEIRDVTLSILDDGSDGGLTGITSLTSVYADLTFRNADVTITALTAISFSSKYSDAGASVTVRDSRMTLNYGEFGISSSATVRNIVKILDSEIDCNCVSTMTSEDVEKPAGIKGNKLLIGGDRTHLTFSGNYMDLYGKTGSEISGGKIDLTAYNMGIWMDNNQHNGDSATISGGTITVKNASEGIYAQNIVLNLTGGTFTTDATVQNGILLYTSIIKFAGIVADIRAKSRAVEIRSYSGTIGRNLGYTVTGGTLTMQASTAPIVSAPYQLCDGYAVYAGNDANTATLIETPDDNNVRKPYVRIEPTQTHTLTLENVMGVATTATHGVGASFTYNAKRPEAGKHFDHWELTVGDSTTSVGTEPSYTSTMPDADAKLTAVYVSCSGGTATCTQKAECTVCGEEYGDYAHNFTAEKAEEKYLASAATCTQAAKYYKSCAVCGQSSKDTEQEATFASGSAVGHAFTAEKAEEKYLASAATCTQAAKYYKSCAVCGLSSKNTEQEATFVSGSTVGHAFTAEKAEEKYLASATTCTQAAKYYKSCAVCGLSSKDTEQEATFVSGSAVGHAFTAEKAEEKYLASAATCTQAAKYYKSCAVCGLSSKNTEQEATFASGSALGHDYKGTVTAPTCTAQGYTTHVCSRCADSKKDTFTGPTGHSFVYGTCTVCGAKEPTAATCLVERFTDCPEAWYHEAIDFVAANKLMLGVSATAFAPEDTLTRAMAVTVFYRMAGSPEVTASATFTDVPVGEYFSEAVAWAQAQGVVNGVSPTEFAPNEPITREQIAAILWRYSGSPKINGDLSKFVDAAKISDYAVDAFKWASAEGIFNGDEKGRLNPTDNATRAEFATIIKNYLAGTYSCPKLAK